MTKKTATTDEDNRVWINPLDIKVFQNPRSAKNRGFTVEEMAKLREGIQRDGLDHPLLVWLTEDKDGKKIIRLIAGERRLRSILHLREDDAEAKESNQPRVMCKNPVSRKQESALDVYSKVECKTIECANEREARRRSIQENTLHAELSDFELLEQVDVMEKEGFTRVEQADTLGVSEAHISQSHSLLASHPKIIEYMARGLLNRTAAITFLNVPREKTEAVLDRAMVLTHHEAEEKERAAMLECNQALETLEDANSELQVAQFTGDRGSAKKARRTIQRATKTASKAKDKAQAAGKKKNPKLTVETIHQAAKEVDAAGDIKRPESTKSMRRFKENFSEILLKEGDLIVRPDTKDKYDREHIRILHDAFAFCIGENKVKHPFEILNPVKK